MCALTIDSRNQQPTQRQSPDCQSWISYLLQLHHDLTRERIHAEARALRARAALTLRGTKKSAAVFPPELLDLVPLLDIRNPTRTLAWSVAITNAVMAQVLHRPRQGLYLAGLVGALVERELWELPRPEGGMSQNAALARLSGVYFTPPNVAWYMTVQSLGRMLQDAMQTKTPETILEAARIKVLDLGCGAGIFLAAALEVFSRFHDKLSETRPDLESSLGSREDFIKQVATNQLLGVDSSARAVDVTRRLLSSISNAQTKDMKFIVAGDAIVRHDKPLRTTCSRYSSVPRTRYGIDWQKLLPDGKVDVVIMNPPFGRFRFLESELDEKSRALSHRVDKVRLARFGRAYAKELSDYYRSLPEYKPAATGILDWQRLFIARGLSLLRPLGRMCVITPGSLIADRSSASMRRHLFTTSSVLRIDRLTETAKLFPGVNQPTCIVVAEKRPGTTRFIMTRPTRSLQADPSDEFLVTLSALQHVSGTNLAVPTVDSKAWHILEKLHMWPRLGDNARIINQRGEFDLTVYKRFMGRGNDLLIRGDHVERFRLRSPRESTREGYVDREAFLRALERSAKVKHVGRHRLVGRQCAFLEKKRRLSFAVVRPGCVVGNSCNYLLWEAGNQREGLLFLAGLLNSSLLEWRFRLTSSNNHVNNYEIDDLPIPDTDVVSVARVSGRMIESYRRLPFGASATADVALEDQLDATVFRIYGVEPAEAHYIMSQIEPMRANRVTRLLESSE